MSFTATLQQFILISLVKNIRFLTAAFEINPVSSYNILIETFWGISAAYLIGFILLNSFVFHKVLWQKRIDTRLLKITANLYIVHARVLFFPIQFLFSAIISLYNTPSANQSEAFYQKIGWLILTIIFSPLNFSLVFIKEFLLYKCTHVHGDSYAAKNNLRHQLIFFYKGAMLTVFYFNQDELIGMRIGSFFHVIMWCGPCTRSSLFTTSVYFNTLSFQLLSFYPLLWSQSSKPLLHPIQKFLAVWISSYCSFQFIQSRSHYLVLNLSSRIS